MNVFCDVVDTGERQQLLGQTAKHLKITQRHVAEPGACQASYDTQEDGWFVPAPAKYATGRIELGSKCADKVIYHGSPAAIGFPVIQSQGNVSTQILELSHERLDPWWFAMPAGFSRVDRLAEMPPKFTWTQALESDWTQLKYAVSTWFD